MVCYCITTVLSTNYNGNRETLSWKKSLGSSSSLFSSLFVYQAIGNKLSLLISATRPGLRRTAWRVSATVVHLTVRQQNTAQSNHPLRGIVEI